MRKSKYRLKVIIKKDYAEKTSTNEISKSHLKTISKNINILNKYGLNILDKYENDKILSKYVNEKKFDDVIIEEYSNKGKQELEHLIKQYIEHIFTKFEKADTNEENVFEKYKISLDKDMLEKLHFIKDGLWDLTFSNCFYINGEFYFYDQEWYEKNMPIEFIIYRCLECFGALKRRININELYKKLNIYEYIDKFKELDDRLQEQIRNDKIFKLTARGLKTPKMLIDEIKTLQNEKNEIQNKNNEILNKNNELTNNSNELQNINNDLINKNNLFEQEINHLNEENNKYKQQIATLNNEITLMKKTKAWKIREFLIKLKKN